MLRRAENVTIGFKPGLLTGRGWLTVAIGRALYRVGKISKAEFAEANERQRSYPVQLVAVRERIYWRFQDRFYWDNDGLDSSQVHALLVTRQQRQQGRIERAQAMVAMGAGPQGQDHRRDVIADDVKQFVWMRDGGRCKNCGAQVELQFDHVIPVAMGGSSTAENLQILCGPCNRRKSAGLTVR